AGSSWYFLRYCDPRNAERFISREADAYWMGAAAAGVDLYIGGSEHTVGHLLYSRFWHKVLFDLGEVGTPEPFAKLFHQGMITSYAYQRPDKSIVSMDEVREEPDGSFVETKTGTKLSPIVTKMSKRYKNVINPDDVIAEFGADTFRLYEMYMGPLDASKPWNTKDTVGCHRFLQRAWRLSVDEQTGALRLADKADPAVEKQLHKTIAKVEADVPRLAFNTAIAAMMEFVNVATSAGGLTRPQLESFALILAPFAPHMAEELWSRLGHSGSLAHHAFPVADPSLAVDDTVEIPVQIAGKVRAKIMVAKDATKEAIQAAAMAEPKVAEFLAGKTIQKIVVVPGKMVNIVV
ncbi:MAG: class I tRNA ligase family protein, partial [Phycisphaerales bacterium]|nr:class I tRNA ligase family protein [Phycisphaerales bacterium]